MCVSTTYSFASFFSRLNSLNLLLQLTIFSIICCFLLTFRWRIITFIFTLSIYATFHASRKPISVVKSVLHPNCTEIAEKENKTITPQNATFCMWPPFDTENYNIIFGYLDLAYLLSYAIGLFIRYLLSIFI